MIITSFLFPDGHFSQSRLDAVLAALDGDKTKLVIDLSCRRQGEGWFVAMNKWQTITDMEVNQGMPPIPPVLHSALCSPVKRYARTIASPLNKQTPLESIRSLEPYCSEFLIHAADNEGLQRGIDEALVSSLARWCSIPVTYAGGGRSLDDLDMVARLSGGRVDLTIGSALDCFGGSGVRLADCVEWNRKQESGVEKDS